MKNLFYYISAGSLYTSADKMLKKIEDTLDVFAENKEKIRILWYQDPAFQDLFLKDTEGVLSHYRRLLSDFEARDIGMIETQQEEDFLFWRNMRDEPFQRVGLSPSERRAVEQCAAYYGDPGYYAECFLEAGKPVMIQDPGIITEGKDAGL